MHILKRITCFFLTFLILATAIFTASAYTTDDIADAALDIVFRHEGVYTSIVIDDNGAVSLGKIGWHGLRALQLLKTIVDANPQQAEEILSEDLYNEILDSPDSAWDARIFTEEEKAIVEVLLATEESKTAQDEIAFRDVKSYIIHGQSMGITDGKVLVYFADLENQMGQLGAENVVKLAIEATGSASEITLEDIYDAAMNDKTASSSPTRRKSTYNYCNVLSFDSQGVTRVFKTGEYKIIASSLRIRSGPGTTFSVVTDPIPNGTKINVTEVSGDWGKVIYKGETGWINLCYAEYTATSSKPDGKPDLNGNGKVDAADARLVLRVAAKIEKLSASDRKIADVNSDGKVTAADARIILRMAAKLQ